MKKSPFLSETGRSRTAAVLKLLALAAALVLPSAAVRALQTTANFNVSISLHTGATCGTGSGSALATVVCNSGGYRFTAHLKKDELSLSGDGYAGAGTSTAYRLVSLSDRQYIEMTVGW